MIGTIPLSVLPDRFIQERKFLEEDEGGGWRMSEWDIVNAALEGRMGGGTPFDVERGGKHEEGMAHTFYCLASADIKRGDRLTIVKRGRTLIYSVQGISNPALADHHLQCMCNEYAPGVAGQGTSEDMF